MNSMKTLNMDQPLVNGCNNKQLFMYKECAFCKKSEGNSFYNMPVLCWNSKVKEDFVSFILNFYINPTDTPNK